VAAACEELAEELLNVGDDVGRQDEVAALVPAHAQEGGKDESVAHRHVPVPCAEPEEV